MNKHDPLNRTTAPMVLRFFDICFKQGVLDAHNFSDDYGAREFLTARKEDWRFGVLGEPDDFDWEMFRFTLYRWARQNHMTKFGEGYIYRILKKNYLWCLLPYCMRFYLMGIEEWLTYPNPSGLELFKHEGKVHWAPNPDVPRKITKDDFRYYMQDFAYQYRRLPEEQMPIASKTMDEYNRAIYDLTHKYVKESKVRIPGE